jgi:hypothetical protein
MPGYVRRGGEQWFQHPDGTWTRWDPAAASWQQGTPPAPLPGDAPEPGWPEYRSVSSLWKAVVILLAVATTIDAFAVASDLIEVELLGRIATRGSFTLSEAETSDLRQMIVGFLQLGMLIATGIPFIIWLHRAYSNLRTLGIDGLRFRRWWAIGGWFIPIFALFRPKQVVNDVWRGSDPERPDRGQPSWEVGPVPWWWMVWWLCFIMSNLFAQFSLLLGTPGVTAEELRTSSLALVVSDSLSVVAGVLAILIVRSASLRQIARAERLGVEPSG